MLIGQCNTILLSDFGVATTAHSTSSMSSIQMPIGTIPYMAPEQIQAQACPASDQYALGIVVYEWLCGMRPFEGSYTEIFAKHLMIPPPSLLEKVPTLPPEVEQVVFQALAKDPKERFASVLDFASALEQASQSQPDILPDPVTSLNQSEQSQSSVSPLEATQSNQSHAPTIVITPPDLSPQPMTEASSPSPTSHTPEASSASWPIPQLIGHLSRRKVIVGLVGLTLTGGGITWFVTSQKSTPKPVPHMTPTGPTPTPAGPTPTPTPLSIGTLLYTHSGHPSAVLAVTWSPDGKHIASGSWDRTVQVWDAMDGGKYLHLSGTFF